MAKTSVSKRIVFHLAALTIAQLVQYNTYPRRRKANVKRERHNISQKSPVPIYVGVTVHAKTHNCDLVETLQKLRISISNDRFLMIDSSNDRFLSTQLGNEVCRRHHQQRAVSSSSLRIGLFTTTTQVRPQQKIHSTALAFDDFSIHLLLHPKQYKCR